MAQILYVSVYYLFNIISFILLVRILLSWFPNIDWGSQPAKFIRGIADPILEPCRKIIPPIYGMDFSPIVTFIILGGICNVTLSLIRKFLF